MKKILYTLIIGLSFSLYSCFDEELSLSEQIQSTPNVFGFSDKNKTVGGIADGSEYQHTINLQLFGPTSDQLSGTYNGTVTVDPSSTAEEGVHYRIDNNTVSVSSDGNLTTTFTFTQLSEGVESPNTETLILDITGVDGSGNVVGGTSTINLNYLCPSNLDENTYHVYGTYKHPTLGDQPDWDHGIQGLTKTDVTEFLTETSGHWGPGVFAGLPHEGFFFTDLCDELTIPAQNLAGYYGNIVEGSGEVLEDGSMYFEYTVCFGGACREYTANYDKQ